MGLFLGQNLPSLYDFAIIPEKLWGVDTGMQRRPSGCGGNLAGKVGVLIIREV